MIKIKEVQRGGEGEEERVRDSRGLEKGKRRWAIVHQLQPAQTSVMLIEFVFSNSSCQPAATQCVVDPVGVPAELM